MTRLLPKRLLALLLVGTGILAAGCGKGTYLEVRVTGGLGLSDIYGLRMALTLTRPGGSSALHATDVIRDNGKPIKFPATMAFALDDETGALRIDATALGSGDVPLGFGTAMTTIMHDKTWTVPVNLAVP